MIPRLVRFATTALLFALIAGLTSCRAITTGAATGRTLISHRGSLPVAAEFDTGDGLQVLHVSTSAFAEEDIVWLDVQVYVDGVTVGTQALFSNHAGVHRTLTGPAIPLRLGAGRHSIELRAGNSATYTDDNDRFDVVLIER